MERASKNDVISGFLIFLIALPLCMGIAMASGFPPVAGILTAIVGGGVSFLGSSRLTIKGPAAGLIVIAVAAVSELGMGDPLLGYKRCLAVCFMAALFQIAFAFLRLGRFAEIMPPSIIHGMLAAIGVIIMAKQIHLLFGVSPVSRETFDLLAEIPNSIKNLNPEIFSIGFLALLILIGLPLIKKPWAKKVPAPLVAIFIGMPLAMIFDFEHSHHYKLFEHDYIVGPEYLVTLPGNLLSAIMFPDFSQILTLTSFKYIIMFALVGTVESLLTVSAVDSIDPEQNISDLDKDLLTVGVGNVIASLIGGLPMISEIVRSKANIDNGAKSYWANFFHGLFLLLFVAAFPKILHMIPLAILAAMLVYTGSRLAAPAEFLHMYRVGKDQFFLFFSTFMMTLFTDLLVGVCVGIVLKILLHLLRGAPLKTAFKPILAVTNQDGDVRLEVSGPSLFSNYLSIKREVLKRQSTAKNLTLDFHQSSIVDHTTQIKIKDLQRRIGADNLAIIGLEKHSSASRHPHATKVLLSSNKLPQKKLYKDHSVTTHKNG